MLGSKTVSERSSTTTTTSALRNNPFLHSLWNRAAELSVPWYPFVSLFLDEIKKGVEIARMRNGKVQWCMECGNRELHCKRTVSILQNRYTQPHRRGFFNRPRLVVYYPYPLPDFKPASPRPHFYVNKPSEKSAFSTFTFFSNLTYNVYYKHEHIYKYTKVYVYRM